MIKFKDPSLSLSNLSPQMVLGMVIASDLYSRHGQDVVITSINDGNHSTTSLHYSGNAVDLRIHYFTEEQTESVFNALKSILTIDFDVVLEKDHIHLEYQPKKR